MLITASIVTHNTPAHMLSKALDSLCNSNVSEIFVIDNSPVHPHSPELPVGMTSRLHYITSPNKGFGAAHNIGMRKSIEMNADYHLIINPDVYWEGDAIAPLAEYMQSHQDVGIAMPRVIYPDGVLQYACRMLPSPCELIMKRFLPNRMIKKRMHQYLLKDADHTKIFNVPYLLGSILLFRVEAIKREGIFDERFFMYPEDIDITRRYHRHWKTLFLPASTVVHHHQAASRSNWKMLRIHIFNMIKYFNKWGWIFDKERRHFNRQLLDSYPRSKYPESGRG